MGLLSTSQSLTQVKAYINHEFNQRLVRDYQQMLIQLSNYVPTEVISQLPPLEPVEVDLIPKSKSTVRPKSKVKMEDRCLALTSTNQRCPRQKAPSNQSGVFCLKHLNGSPPKRLDRIHEYFQAIKKSSKNQSSQTHTATNDYQMMSLVQQKGRKYYQLPADLESIYAPVTLVDIEGQIYIKDTDGLLYGISNTMPLMGRMEQHLVKWYKQVS